MTSDLRDTYLAHKACAVVEAVTPQTNAWVGQAADGLRGNLATQGVLRPEAAPSEDFGRAADPAGGQGPRLRLPASNQCHVRSVATQSCLCSDLSNRTTTALGAKRSALAMFSGA